MGKARSDVAHQLTQRRCEWSLRFAPLTATICVEPLQHAPPRRGACRKRRLQADSRRSALPSRASRRRRTRRAAAEHEIGVEFVERDAARGRDRARDRRDAGELDRDGVDQARQLGRRQRRQRPARMPSPPPAAGRSPTGDKLRRLAQEIRQRLLASRRRQSRGQIVALEIGPQRDLQRRLPRAQIASRNSADSA